MKPSLLIFAFFIIEFSLHAQPDQAVVIGKADSIHSTILNENRNILVHLPSGYNDNLYSAQRYPVIYLLDGDAHFPSVAGMVHQLSEINGNTICPEMIIVAIPNTDRTRDLTPTHVESDLPYVDRDFARTSGGGEKFMAFIEKELIPYIDASYHTQPYRMLIGHSFGGLTVINTLIHHKDIFNSYISIDPSMWWDHERLLKESQAALKSVSFEGKSLYLGIANTMEDGMTIKKIKKDTSANSRHIRSILNLQDHLQKNPQNGLKYMGKYYDGDDHGSVPLITEYDALRFIFKDYPIHFKPNDFKDTTEALKNKIVTHYQKISTIYGYTIAPAESMMNGMGYQALGSKQYTKAKSFFSYNVDQYPGSGNVYDSYGDYFNAIGDKPHAIEQFKKALSIKESPETRKKLDALENKSMAASNTSLQDLDLYVGEYILPGEGIEIKTFVRDGALRILATGRDEAELVPAKTHEFTVKGVTGYLIKFDIVDGKSVGIGLDVPEGMFKAVRKKP